MNKPGLMLSLGDSLTNFEDSMKDLGATFRIEGMSLNAEEMRIFGEEVVMDVTYADLLIGRRIGQGACSAVHVAEHERSGQLFAVKMFNAFDKEQRSQMIKEIKILTEVDCDCVVPIKGAWHHEGNIGIIIEYMDHGSLEFMCNEKIDVDEQALAAVVCQILWGLSYLHFDKRLHRDIKPANVLINSEGSVKLSDFGISTALQNTLHSDSAVGSYRYMSPERLLAERYDSSSDIWSLGIMIIQLWTKIYPFHYCCSSPVDLLTELESIDFAIFLEELQFPQRLRAFLLRILARDPSKRATAEALLEDNWFADNHIGELGTAQAVVKAWLSENVTNSPHFKGPTDVVTPKAGALHHAGDHLFEEGAPEHPLLAPGLARAHSQGMEESINSKEGSIKTEISLERGSPRGLGGEGSVGDFRGVSPAEAVFDAVAQEENNLGSAERMNRLNKLLPRSTKFEKTAEDVEDDLLLSGGGMGGIVGVRVGDKRRSREFGTGSTARSSTGEISSIASKTQSTANCTTGSHDITIGTNFVVPPEGINFDENDEDLYYSKEEFEQDGEDEDGMDVQMTSNGKVASHSGVGERAKMDYDEDYWAHK